MKEYRKNRILREFWDFDKTKTQELLYDFSEARKTLLPSKEYKEDLYSRLEALRYKKESNIELIKRYFSSTLAFTFIVSVVWIFYTQTDIIVEPVSEYPAVKQSENTLNMTLDDEDIPDESWSLDTWSKKLDTSVDSDTKELFQDDIWTDSVSFNSEATDSDSNEDIKVEKSEDIDELQMRTSVSAPDLTIDKTQDREKNKLDIYTRNKSTAEWEDTWDEDTELSDSYDMPMRSMAFSEDSYGDDIYQNKELFEKICENVWWFFDEYNLYCTLWKNIVCKFDSLEKYDDACEIFYRKIQQSHISEADSDVIR